MLTYIQLRFSWWISNIHCWHIPVHKWVDFYPLCTLLRTWEVTGEGCALKRHGKFKEGGWFRTWPETAIPWEVWHFGLNSRGQIYYLEIERGRGHFGLMSSTGCGFHAHFYLLNPRAVHKRYSNYFQYDIFLRFLARVFSPVSKIQIS